MNRCGIQQNAFASGEEMRRSSITIAVSDRSRENMVCPKPRRVGVLNTSMNDHPLRSLRWQVSHQVDLCEPYSGSDLLDIILTKGGGSTEAEQAYPELAASPPPFFPGSPPSRVSNPMTQDSRFRDELFMTPSPPMIPSRTSLPPSSPSSGRKGGCVRANFGNNPAVRIEGFDCLDRDRRNRSIPALA